MGDFGHVPWGRRRDASAIPGVWGGDWEALVL